MGFGATLRKEADLHFSPGDIHSIREALDSLRVTLVFTISVMSTNRVQVHNTAQTNPDSILDGVLCESCLAAMHSFDFGHEKMNVPV